MKHNNLFIMDKREALEYDFSDRNEAPLNPCEKAPSFRIR